MELGQLLDNYSMAADLASFFFCLTMIILIKGVLSFAQDRKFIYLKRALHFIMVGSMVNVAFYMAIRYLTPMDEVVWFLRAVYHICFMCTLYLFILYLKNMLDVPENKLVKVFSIISRIVFVSAIVADILSPLTNFGFHKEGELWYDPLINPYNIFYSFGVIELFIMLLAYSDRMIRPVRNALLATEAIVLTIMALGAYENSNTMTSFTYILPIVVMMVLLHSRPFDDRTGALGEDSFDNYMKQEANRGLSFDFMILKLSMEGHASLPSELGKGLNSFWHDSFRQAMLFRFANDLYILAVPRTARNGATEEKARYMMENDFRKYYADYQIPYKVLGLFDIDFARTTKELRSMVQYLLVTMGENKMVLVDEKQREELRKIRAIMDNLEDIVSKKDLNDPRVLAYCQPIRNMKTGRFDTGEALMRMSIPDHGMVMPYLFIPLAENMGIIHELTKIMLNKVCTQIRELDGAGYQFKRISINFAASEIRSDRFCPEVLGIIRQNGVDPSRIGIEITESQNEGDFEIVKSKMRELREAGMTLYLDDVGTGYSNLDRIVRYDVDVVKFDRFFLLEAEKDSKVEKMLEHLSQAFKDLEYSLLYEGVENEENEALCMKCGADYIQGFKYSKPVPIEELTNFFEKK